MSNPPQGQCCCLQHHGEEQHRGPRRQAGRLSSEEQVKGRDSLRRSGPAEDPEGQAELQEQGPPGESPCLGKGHRFVRLASADWMSPAM